VGGDQPRMIREPRIYAAPRRRADGRHEKILPDEEPGKRPADAAHRVEAADAKTPQSGDGCSRRRLPSLAAYYAAVRYGETPRDAAGMPGLRRRRRGYGDVCADAADDTQRRCALHVARKRVVADRDRKHQPARELFGRLGVDEVELAGLEARAESTCRMTETRAVDAA